MATATNTPLVAKNHANPPVEVDLQALPDGALATGSWIDSMITQGLGWTVTVGDLSAPVSGGGDTAIIDQNKPQLMIGVPAGFVMRPIRVTVDAEVPLIVTDADEAEILIAVDRTQFLPTDGTFVTEVPLNMRTDIIGGCPLTANSLYSANVTNPTLSIELDRVVTVADIVGAGGTTTTWGNLQLEYEPKRPPYIVGPAIFIIYWGGTVDVSAYAQVQFVAFPSSKVTNLS